MVRHNGRVVATAQQEATGHLTFNLPFGSRDHRAILDEGFTLAPSFSPNLNVGDIVELVRQPTGKGLNTTLQEGSSGQLKGEAVCQTEGHRFRVEIDESVSATVGTAVEGSLSVDFGVLVRPEGIIAFVHSTGSTPETIQHWGFPYLGLDQVARISVLADGECDAPAVVQQRE